MYVCRYTANSDYDLFPTIAWLAAWCPKGSSSSSSSAHHSLLLDIGLSNFSPSRSIFGYSYLALASRLPRYLQRGSRYFITAIPLRHPQYGLVWIEQLSRLYVPDKYLRICSGCRHQLFAISPCCTVAREQFALCRTQEALNKLLVAYSESDVFTDSAQSLLNKIETLL
jgi:hypothetical protein